MLVDPLAEWLGESVRAVWEHHERFDGNGYPRGLSGTDISFAARVVSVADSYDVMTSARSYKKPMSAEAARAELAACSGTQFDPIVVRSFLNVSLGRLRLMTGPLAWLAQLALLEPSGVVHAGSSSTPIGCSRHHGRDGRLDRRRDRWSGSFDGFCRCDVDGGGDRRECRRQHGRDRRSCAADDGQRTDTVAVVQTVGRGCRMRRPRVADRDGRRHRRRRRAVAFESSTPLPVEQTDEFVFDADDDGGARRTAATPSPSPIVEPTVSPADDDLRGTPLDLTPTST